jgi:hypothetical protein
MEPAAIQRTRLGLELPHPLTVPDPAALAAAWLADPDVRSFLQVHEWDGGEWLVRERWLTLVRLADALDRASGAKRSSPAIARLLPAAEIAGDRVDRIVPAVAAPAKRPKSATGAKAPPAKAQPAKRKKAAPAKGAPRSRP